MAIKYVLTKTGDYINVSYSPVGESMSLTGAFDVSLVQQDTVNSFYSVSVKNNLGSKLNLSTENILTIGGVAPDNSSSNAFVEQIRSFFPSASASSGVGAFSKEFLIADWIANTGVYSITVNSGEHEKTAISDVIIYKNTGGIYTIVYVDSVNVDSFLGVEINVLGSPDMRFDGRVVIL